MHHRHRPKTEPLEANRRTSKESTAQASQGTARQIELWAQVLTGMELNEADAVRVLDLREWTLRRQQLTQLTGQSGS